MSTHDETAWSEGDFRVHSVKEPTEEPDSFLAYVPVVDDDASPSADRDWQGATFEAEVIRAQASAGPIPRGRSIRYSVFAEPRVAVEGHTDFLLAGPRGETTELRVGREAQHLLGDDAAFLLEPELLGQTGVHVFRGAPVEFVPDPGQEPWQADIWLPIARIHRPARDGCSAVYTVLQTDVDQYDAEFAVAGLGAKGKLEFSVTFGRSYPAKATCKEACVRAKVAVMFGTTYVDGKPFVYGTRVKVWDVDPACREYRDIPPELDQCNWPETKAPSVGRTIERLRNATGESDDALGDEVKFERTVSGSMSLGVAFAGTPVSLSVGYTRVCGQQTALKTQFVPGADYLGYNPRIDNPLEKCWTVLGA